MSMIVSIDPAARLGRLERAAASPRARVEAILAALVDPQPLVRERAVALAARYLGPETLGALVADGDDAVRRNAGLAALERQGPVAVPYLIDLARGPDLELAMFAVQVLARLRDRRAVAVLLALVEHADDNLAHVAAEALGDLGVVEAVPILIAHLAADPWRQLPAIDALGRIGDARAEAALTALVDDGLLGDLALEALARIAAPGSAARFTAGLIGEAQPARREHHLRGLGAICARHGLPLRLRVRLRSAVGDPPLSPLSSSPATSPLPSPSAPGSPGGSGPLAAFLAGIMAPPPVAADAVPPDLALAMAAAHLILAAPLGALVPLVVARAAESADRVWIETVARHHRLRRDGLRALLDDFRPRVREGALRLGAGRARDRERLVALLDDPASGVREAASLALGRIHAGASAAELVRRMCGPPGPEAEAATQALALFKPSELRPLCALLAVDAPPAAQIAALAVAEARPRVISIRALASLLRSRHADVRAAVVRALGARPEPSAQSHTISALDDPHGRVRTDAVRALAHRRHEPAIVSLLARYEKRAMHERLEIIDAVGKIGGDLARAFLASLEHDPVLEVRRVAARGSAALAVAADADLLLRLANAADWTLRHHAAWGLGRLLRGGVTGVAATLLELARDDEVVVARVARTALGEADRP
jgi:HEAT repeat protein